jgi:hypothetical protein
VPVGAVLLTGLALSPLALSERAAGSADWIEHTSLLSRAAEAPKQFLVGLDGPLEILSALIAGLLAASAIGLIIRFADRRERALARDIAIIAGGALALPLLMSATHVLDVFDGRNVIAAWIPSALLVAAGLGIAGAPRTGALLGTALCIVSLLVIVGTNLIPGYQRDDWRGVASALPDHARASVVVTPPNGLLPLGIYLPALRKTMAASIYTSELDFVALRTERTGRPPLPAIVPTRPPPGYRLAELKKTETYAVARFIAPYPVTTNTRSLLRVAPESGSEVLVRH